PMTRTVEDAAALLAAIAGPDPADPATAESTAAAEALRSLVLSAEALSGVRLAGVRGDVAEPEGEKPDQHRKEGFEAAVAAMRAAGAVTVDVELPKIGYEDELAVLHYEFAPGMARYLAALGPHAPMRTLADIQAWNLEHADEALKFGQVHVNTAVAI